MKEATKLIDEFIKMCGHNCSRNRLADAIEKADREEVEEILKRKDLTSMIRLSLEFRLKQLSELEKASN